MGPVGDPRFGELVRPANSAHTCSQVQATHQQPFSGLPQKMFLKFLTSQNLCLSESSLMTHQEVPDQIGVDEW